jgi:hypothetical protein
MEEPMIALARAVERQLKKEIRVARSRQVCIEVVEALLVAIYLPKGKDVYIPIRPTLLPETTTFSCLYTAEPSVTFV